MEFFAVNGKRPVRLREVTRAFAFESMNHRYGKMTRETPSVCMDDYEGFASLTELEKYDAAIRRIAQTAPIRICDGERVSGAATLGEAINHMVPATVGGVTFCVSASHLTIDFETVLKKGVNYLRRHAQESLKKYRATDKEPFIHSCIHCLDCLERVQGVLMIYSCR